MIIQNNYFKIKFLLYHKYTILKKKKKEEFIKYEKKNEYGFLKASMCGV